MRRIGHREKGHRVDVKTLREALDHLDAWKLSALLNANHVTPADNRSQFRLINAARDTQLFERVVDRGFRLLIFWR